MRSGAADHGPETRFFTTPPGGIMTREVGAITGEVEAWAATYGAPARGANRGLGLASSQAAVVAVRRRLPMRTGSRTLVV